MTTTQIPTDALRHFMDAMGAFMAASKKLFIHSTVAVTLSLTFCTCTCYVLQPTVNGGHSPPPGGGVPPGGALPPPGGALPPPGGALPPPGGAFPPYPAPGELCVWCAFTLNRKYYNFYSACSW